MSTEKNIQVVQDFFAAIGSANKQRVLDVGHRRYRVDRSGGGLAAGRYAPRVRRVGGCA